MTTKIWSITAAAEDPQTVVPSKPLHVLNAALGDQLEHPTGRSTLLLSFYSDSCTSDADDSSGIIVTSALCSLSGGPGKVGHIENLH
ncbi:hypothetical protein HGRIS_000862 [Hohenbuehelia grisea]|uniref:Uncharacterized protein n=1 Tax=Hohenbuehelia grisea TaxID=104357 RepID=A0ABR3IQ00_9AGAR